MDPLLDGTVGPSTLATLRSPIVSTGTGLLLGVSGGILACEDAAAAAAAAAAGTFSVSTNKIVHVNGDDNRGEKQSFRGKNEDLGGPAETAQPMSQRNIH